MTDMLGEISRAILSCDAPCDDYFNRDVGTLLSVNPEAVEAIARAALLAMREPDPDAEKYATAGGWLEVEGGFESLLHDYIDHILGQAV